MQSPSLSVFSCDETSAFRVYPQRFWILFVFVFLVFNQCMFWLTFSPIANATQEFYHVSEEVVDLLLNWGPIVFLPTLPLVYLLLNARHGLRKSMLIFATVSLIATVIRLIPLIVTSPSSADFRQVAVPFLHIGQILIATTGPFAMALASQLSCLWFAPHERTRATTVAVLGASFGGAAAFLISPHLVFESSRVPHLLYLHAGQAILACLSTAVYFPAEPPSPPSLAAQMLRVEQSTEQRFWEKFKRSAQDVLHCFSNRSCILLTLAGGILGGTLAAWTGLLNTILTPLGYSDTQAGWFGFGQTIASIIGALAIGSLADRPRFQRSLKLLILVTLSISLIFCLLFQLSVGTVFWPEHPPVPSSALSIGFLFSMIGLFSGATVPLIYECLAEMMHPLPESLTASLYTELFNLVTLIFIAIAPNRSKLMNLLALLMMTVAIIMIACAQVTYKRKDEEQKIKKSADLSLVQFSPTESNF